MTHHLGGERTQWICKFEKQLQYRKQWNVDCSPG